jgi:hypothetical protein
VAASATVTAAAPATIAAPAAAALAVARKPAIWAPAVPVTPAAVRVTAAPTVGPTAGPTVGPTVGRIAVAPTVATAVRTAVSVAGPAVRTAVPVAGPTVAMALMAATASMVARIEVAGAVRGDRGWGDIGRSGGGSNDGLGFPRVWTHSLTKAEPRAINVQKREQRRASRAPGPHWCRSGRRRCGRAAPSPRPRLFGWGAGNFSEHIAQDRCVTRSTPSWRPPSAGRRSRGLEGPPCGLP